MPFQVNLCSEFAALLCTFLIQACNDHWLYLFEFLSLCLVSEVWILIRVYIDFQVIDLCISFSIHYYNFFIRIS